MILKPNQRQTIAWILFLLLLILPSLFITPKALGRSLYPLLILSALINHRRTLIFLLAPLILMMPAALYFSHVYHAPMNASFWLIVQGTDATEAGDFLRQLWIFLVPALMILFATLMWIWKNSTGPVYTNRKRRLATFILLIVPIYAVGTNYSAENVKVEMNHHFTDSYPWSFLSGYMVAQEEIEMYRKTDFTTRWNLQAKTDDLLKSSSEVVVLVIGESARRDRHEVYGYLEKTTPEMQKLKDAGELMTFSDFITLHPHTANAVPTLMTKFDNIHEMTEVPPSFVQIYRDAGFKTYWLSNQAAMGGNENRISVYARRSDYFHSLHISSMNLPWAYDGELLPEFDEILQKPDSKKFIVLHLQGSHYGFDKRYPQRIWTVQRPVRQHHSLHRLRAGPRGAETAFTDGSHCHDVCV